MHNLSILISMIKRYDVFYSAIDNPKLESNFVQNAMENVENKILEVLEDVGEKMAPVIKVRREMLMVRKCFLMIVFQNPNGLERNLAENFRWTTS